MRPSTRQIRALLVLLGTLLCVAATVGLFARAYPMVDAGLALDRNGAIARARSLAAAAGFTPADVRTAALFEGDDSLSTYVDFAAGGPDSVRALARGREVPLYRWAVRLYRPGDVRETRVAFAADGRVIGLARRIPEGEARPLVSDTAGRIAADAALAQWGSQDVAGWRLAGRSTVTQPRSGRVDRTYRYERVGRRIGDAPIRADVTVTGPATPEVLRGGALGIVGQPAGQPAGQVAGQAGGFVGRYGAEPLGVHVYADLPDAWGRRYGEMRASNNTLALLPYPVLTVFVLGAFGALIYYGRQGRVRWRPAAMVGGTVGVLMAAAGLNELPVAWFGYDTATAPGTFIAGLALSALATGAVSGVWVTVCVAAAEACARRAFPTHYDWFAYPRFAGAPPIARRVLGAYALAAFGFAYVTVFYVTMRGSFGWWVPTGTLDDPNQIATPAPWVSAAGTALFAGTWEEAMFRGVPLALLAFWARDKKNRALWLGLGVVVTALTFGFGHANYPSWPAYSRGVELFLEAVLWAVLALRVGLPTTIVAHTLYDLTWFGLFALHGRGAAYRATAAAVVLAFALPALVVAVNWWQRRRAVAAGLALPEPPRFADVEREMTAVEDVARHPVTVTPAAGSPGAVGVHPSPAPALGGSAGEVWDRPPVVLGKKEGKWWTAVAVGTFPAGVAAGEASRAEPVPNARDGWTPASAGVTVEASRATPAPTAAAVSPRTRLAAALVTALALLVALLAPHAPPLGPAFTATRARVAATADSALRARGVDPAGWDRTLVTGGGAHDQTVRFLRESLGRTRSAALVRSLGDSYLAPAAWNVRYARHEGTAAVRREGWVVVVSPDGRARIVLHDVADDAPGGAPSADSARALAAAAVRTRGYDPARLREAEFTQTARPHRLDTDVEYVDPAVALPAGATARVAVALAGTEAVRVGREVRLPEPWLLAERDRASRGTLVGVVAATALFGLVLVLVIRGVRAEPRVAPVLTRRTLLAVAGAVALLTIGRSVLTLPDRFAAWDTNTPWSLFLLTLAIGAVLGGVIAGAASAGLWSLADALRRRTGVPFLPITPAAGPAADPTRRTVARDALLLGAALGTALPALAGLGDFVKSTAVAPSAPATALDALLPWATSAVAVLGAALNAPLAAIPALAIVAGLRTARDRWLAVGVVAALTAVGAQAAADATIGGGTLALGAVAGVALVTLVVWAFGRAAALPWVVAGPAAALVANVRAVRGAANATDAINAGLGAVVAAVLLAVIYRVVVRGRGRGPDRPLAATGGA